MLLPKGFGMKSSHDEAAAPAANCKRPHAPQEIWHCREYWVGDSRDGQYTNGDGYNYFQMKGEGQILRAIEYYETDDGEEKSTPLPELEGNNWFEVYGFEDDEILEPVSEHDFVSVEMLLKQ